MDLYAILVTTHVLAGVMGATLVVVPLMTPKGQVWHRRAGLVVTVAMAITAGTGLAIAIWWLALPIVSPSPHSSLGCSLDWLQW